MAAFTNVPAASAVGAAQAASRVAGGSRFTSADQIEGLSGSPFIGMSDQWRPTYDQDSAQAGFNRYPQGSQPQSSLTPLVSRSAGSFAASLSSQQAVSDPRQGPTLFLTDLQRAVGIYEFNMRLTSGAFATPGSVVNRFS